MRRFLVFAYMYHEASGGWDDLVGDYDDFHLAVRAAIERVNDENAAQIVDLMAREVFDVVWGVADSVAGPIVSLRAVPLKGGA
jgi:hypothetical protein